MNKYYIRYEKMGNTWHYMIYRKRFLFRDEFFERWNSSDNVKERITQLNRS